MQLHVVRVFYRDDFLALGLENDFVEPHVTSKAVVNMDDEFARRQRCKVGNPGSAVMRGARNITHGVISSTTHFPLSVNIGFREDRHAEALTGETTRKNTHDAPRPAAFTRLHRVLKVLERTICIEEDDHEIAVADVVLEILVKGLAGAFHDIGSEGFAGHLGNVTTLGEVKRQA